MNKRYRMIACPVVPAGNTTSDHVTTVDSRNCPPVRPLLASQISPEAFIPWAKALQFAFTEIGHFDLHWPDNTKTAKACEACDYGKVLAGPHHVIAAQGRRRLKSARDSTNHRSIFAVLNAASHELVEGQLASQHKQVVMQLDPALAGVFPKARPLPLRGTLEQPPRCLLDQRQAVDGIGPLPSERLARERHLAKILRIEQGGQEKHDVGVEERRLDGGELQPLHSIARAGHGTDMCVNVSLYYVH
ncbi:hypothetical protein THAOC_05036 [Thalassiosira oceanica]|uniref:Uncharacterized protein n=1 Tax=Thalassiosira oceanica TaxID=159749 RepID=K0T8B0_THAOC|nr:hypothetical protein THAOC_05036 [Thalassiosira oceanica]|eukprot:EJK73344.1 hypothetical protein THAOC_05036 [Thalassiosira oceanica]